MKISSIESAKKAWPFFKVLKQSRTPNFKGLQVLKMLQTYRYNSPFEINLQGEGAWEFINTWLNLYLIHVEDTRIITPHFAIDVHDWSLQRH